MNKNPKEVEGNDPGVDYSFNKDYDPDTSLQRWTGEDDPHGVVSSDYEAAYDKMMKQVDKTDE